MEQRLIPTTAERNVLARLAAGPIAELSYGIRKALTDNGLAYQDHEHVWHLTSAGETFQRSIEAEEQAVETVSEMSIDMDGDLQCPHCNAFTPEIREVRVHVQHRRFTDFGPGRGYRRDGNFDASKTLTEHGRFECSACGKPVTFPDGYGPEV